MASSFMSFVFSMGIGLVLPPYIIHSVGIQAYGFIGLGNNIVEYASLATIALNAVAGRFIAVCWHRNDKAEASRYFSSVIYADILLAIIICIIGIIFITYIEKILDIPENLIYDVKILFFLLLFNFSCSILNAVLSVATFITDKLYLSSMLNVFSMLVKVLLLVILFSFLPSNIIFVGIAVLISTIGEGIVNIFYVRKLTPHLVFSIKNCQCKNVKDLFFSGIWSSVTKFAQILSDGMDLLISNLWLSSYLMGQLAVSKIIATCISILLSKLSSLFAPRITYNFAQKDSKKIIENLKMNMKLTGFFSNIIFVGVITQGKVFYTLWLPNSDVNLLYILTVLCIQAVLVSGVINGLYNVFVITNRLKINSLFWLCMGFADFIIVITLLSYTDFGIYAVAGVSTAMGFLGNLIFIPIYAARCLQVKWNTFYDIILKYMVGTCALLGICFLLNREFLLDISWKVFFQKSCCIMLIGSIWNYFFFLEKKERKFFCNTLFRKF